MTNPANARTTSRGRTYVWPGDPDPFDSVTSVLSGGLAKPFLIGWAAKMAAECAVNQRDVWAAMARREAVDYVKNAHRRSSEKAAADGSDVHDWAEKMVLGVGIPTLPDELQGFCDSFRRFLDDFKPEYEATEVTVYNRKHRYAGTLDALMRIDGRLYLADYKTGKGIYGETAAQLAAYRYAEFMGLPDGSEVPVPEVFGCAIVHIRPDRYEFVPVDAGERAFRAFLAAQRTRWFAENSDGFLGQPLLPGEDDVFTKERAA